MKISRKNIALIGHGTIGERHLTGIQNEADAFLAGIVVGSVESRDRIKKQTAVSVYTSLDDLLGNVALDGAIVSSPNHLHKEHVVAALEAGCHVLCEKPMAMNSKEAREMIETAQRRKKCLMLAHNLRFMRHTRLAEKICSRGYLGKIYFAQCNWFRSRGIPGLGKWFTQKEFSGGGAMMDAGVHLLDIAWLLMGKPVPLTVTSGIYSLFGNQTDKYNFKKMWAGAKDGVRKMDVEDFASAFIRFSDDKAMQISIAWASNIQDIDCNCVLLGEKGGLFWSKSNGIRVFDATARNVFSYREASRLKGLKNLVGKLKGQFAVKRGNSDIAELESLEFTNMYRHFLDCIDGETCFSSAGDGYVLQTIIDAIYKSATDLSEVKLEGKL